MVQITQADIARALRVHEVAVSCAARMLDCIGPRPLSDHSALCLLTIGTLRPLGFTYPAAAELVSKFDGEIRSLAIDRDHRVWIVFIEREDAKFQIAAVSPRHLDAVLCANPLSLVLALHEPVAHAVTHLAELKAIKALKAAA